MSAGSSARRKIQKAQGTFEGATDRKLRLAREAREAAEKAKLSAEHAAATTQPPPGWDKATPGPEQVAAS
jgi:hypothetical protein